MDSIIVLVVMLAAAAVVAMLTLGPLGLLIGAALAVAAVALGGYRLFRMVTRRTSSSHGVHRRS